MVTPNLVASPTALATVFQSPHSTLERLDLRWNRNYGEHIQRTLALLAMSLATNGKLEELLLYCKFYRRILNSDSRAAVIARWAAFIPVLCNESSIAATYNSNHTLKKLVDNEEDLPDDLRKLLCLNNENSKSQAARLKIIQTHFSKGFISPPFVDMERNLMPHALAWMGREGTVDETTDSFYQFVKSVPNLFEFAMHGKEPRKRIPAMNSDEESLFSTDDEAEKAKGGDNEELMIF